MPVRLAAMLGFLTAVIGVAYFVFSHPGLERLDRMEQEARQLSAQNEALAARNQELESQIVALRDDPRLVERRARETVGLSRPDELIIRFEEPGDAVRVRVWLRVSSEGVELAGRKIEFGALAQALVTLREEMPQAELSIDIAEEVGPIERQRVLDVVEASPMAP